MSAPAYRVVFVDRIRGWRYTWEGCRDRWFILHDLTHSTPLVGYYREVTLGELLVDFTQQIEPVPAPAPAAAASDDWMAVADAAGVTERTPGLQPEVEFTAGPTTWGPAWGDARLAQVVDQWARDLSGGAR